MTHSRSSLWGSQGSWNSTSLHKQSRAEVKEAITPVSAQLSLPFPLVPVSHSLWVFPPKLAQLRKPLTDMSNNLPKSIQLLSKTPFSSESSQQSKLTITDAVSLVGSSPLAVSPGFPTVPSPFHLPSSLLPSLTFLEAVYTVLSDVTS